jgi:hypothetical protein
MEKEMRTDLTNEQYHAHHAISSSDVKAVYGKSLAHWKHAVRKPSAAFAMGSAIHAIVLEPEKDLVLRGPEDRRGNKWKDAVLAADLDGKILLTEGDYDLAAAVAKSALQNAVLQSYMAQPSYVAEASFFATDPITQVEIKCRPDGYIPETGIVFDIKTTQDASPRGFPYELRKYSYDVQAAFYLRTLKAAGYKAEQFVFICVEKVEPFAVGVHTITPKYMDHADRIVTETLFKIDNAKALGEYPTDWPVINEIDLPRWQDDAADQDVFDGEVDF